jgi:hypothetical protein
MKRDFLIVSSIVSFDLTQCMVGSHLLTMTYDNNSAARIGNNSASD